MSCSFPLRVSLLWTACAAACLPAAARADTTIDLYGVLVPFVENARATGATAPGLSPASGGATQVGAAAYTGVNYGGRFQVRANTSNLGFRGARDFTPNLAGFFQIESGIPIEGEGANTWASRNSGVGLKGPWGSVLVGHWDTPYKTAVAPVAALRAQNPYDLNVIANPGFNVPVAVTASGRTGTKADAGCLRPQSNMLLYSAPTLAGLSGQFAFSAGDNKTADNAVPTVDPKLYSLMLKYEIPQLLSVRYAYERHTDYFGMQQLGGSTAGAAAARSRDQAHMLVGILTVGDTRISAVVDRLKYHTDDSTTGAVDGYQRTGWYLLAQQRFGDHQVYGGYGSAAAGSCSRVGGAACVTDGLGARQAQLGYSYSLDKQTDLYVTAYQIRNQRSAQYGAFPSVGNQASVGSNAPGVDTRGIGVGALFLFDVNLYKR
jgi:predicted porin